MKFFLLATIIALSVAHLGGGRRPTCTDGSRPKCPTIAPSPAPVTRRLRGEVEEVDARRHGRKGKGQRRGGAKAAPPCEKEERLCADGSAPIFPTKPPTASPTAASRRLIESKKSSNKPTGVGAGTKFA